MSQNPESLFRNLFDSQTSRLITAVISILLLILAILLGFPFRATNSPNFFIVLQEQLWIFLSLAGPYLFVGLLGAIVGIAELTATFQTYPREALATSWAKLLIFVNAISAILALLIVQAAFPNGNTFIQLLGVGVGFQAIIRTNFVLAKPMGTREGEQTGEVSINLGWLYDQFQTLCRTQIDLEWMDKRRQVVTDLTKRYDTLSELYEIAYYTVLSRATLSDDEKGYRFNRLEELIDPMAPESVAKSSLALMILETGGPQYAKLLLDQVTIQESAMSTASESSKGLTARRLVNQYSLQELVEMAKSLTDNEEILTWVENAAQPVPELSQVHNKSAIAYFLINQLGNSTVCGYLKESDNSLE